jgi:hypothetical protein
MKTPRTGCLALVAIGILSTASSRAQAQGSPGGPHIGVGVLAGSLGLGGELIVGLTNGFEIRGVGNYFKISRSNQSISDISYDASLRLASGSLLADLYLAGPLRLSGGVVLNGNQLTINGKPTSSVTIGDSVYTPSQIGTLSGKIDFKKVAPYLGLGLAGRGHIALAFELGVVFQQSPQVSYTPTTTLTGAAATAFNQNASIEAQNIRDDLKFFKYYPHVALGVTIRL